MTHADDLRQNEHHDCTAIIGWHDLRAMSVTGLYQQIKARDARIDALEAANTFLLRRVER